MSILKNWRDPVKDIKDPLKQRWAEIVQTMDTHIQGVCPLHIYIDRRPLESADPYALEYRVNNFRPITKEAFDRAISGMTEVISEANIELKIPDYIKAEPIEIKDKDAFEFCMNDLIKIRENDPNAVLVAIPEIEEVGDNMVMINGVNLQLIRSSEIDRITKDDIRFVGGEMEVEGKKKPFYVNIDDGKYWLEVPNTDGKYDVVPMLEIDTDLPPYICISDNIVYEGKYKLRLPYLYGSAAWGDKYYGNESDVTIQETRYTYLKEIRAKEKCNEVGYIADPVSGRHINSLTGDICPKCKGTNYVKDDSPFSVTYIDYDKLTNEGKPIPTAIQFAEPPQAALTNAQARVDVYYERMCESLGLLKQNLTNQSGVSKGFDYQQKLSVIYTILKDNMRVLQYVYRAVETFKNINQEAVSQVYMVGELGKSSVSDLLVQLKEAKTNASPPNVIMSLIDQIYLKTLNPEYAELVIDIAHEYDKLYIYGADEITTARANLGNSIGVREVVIHNTIINVLDKYLMQTDERDRDTIIKYLDSYYLQAVPTVTALV